MKTKCTSTCLAFALVFSYSISCSSCYSYHVATHAQTATDAMPANRIKSYTLFWGLINSPQVIHTPVCDSLGSNGVSDVIIKTNFGNAFLTVITLGIYCPVRIEWNCGKPCQQTQKL